MKGSCSLKKVENRQFLSLKNLAMNRLISEIDSPEEDVLSSNPTPPLIPPQPQLSNHTDSLTSLLAKAQTAVKTGALKIEKHLGGQRERLKTYEQQQNQAFITGILMNDPQSKEENSQEQVEALDEQVLKLLQRKTLDDQLKELKKQIKLTNGQLKSYQRQVKGTQKSIFSLADRYNSYFNIRVPVKTPTYDFSGLSYFQLKNFKRNAKKE